MANFSHGWDCAGTYRNLLARDTAWPDFSAAMEARFRSGGQHNLSNDNPFLGA
jgi:hypothetical protein